MTLAVGGALAAQNPAAKKSAGGGAAPSVPHGKEVFEQKCAMCHYATSNEKKIGPGLKGLGKRSTFTVNKNKITDDSLRAWIENGDDLMPPFKDVIDATAIRDVIAYVKTL
jgi:cytochrome c2